LGRGPGTEIIEKGGKLEKGGGTTDGSKLQEEKFEKGVRSQGSSLKTPGTDLDK